MGVDWCDLAERLIRSQVGRAADDDDPEWLRCLTAETKADPGNRLDL